MAPNRKRVDETLTYSVDLTSLQATVKSKFLPLTHPKDPKDEHLGAQRMKVLVSYWDWPADTEPEEVKSKDKSKDPFSIAHIESNLVHVADAASTVAATCEENDEYWAERSVTTDKTQCMTLAQHDTASYWDWHTIPQEEKQTIVEDILEQDEAHRIVSASLNVHPSILSSCLESVSNDEYWTWDSLIMAPHVLDPVHSLENYWDEAADNDKLATIDTLIEYERARQLLSVDYILGNLVHSFTCRNGPTNESSDDYWTWSEHTGDACCNKLVSRCAR